MHIFYIFLRLNLRLFHFICIYVDLKSIKYTSSIAHYMEPREPGKSPDRGYTKAVILMELSKRYPEKVERGNFKEILQKLMDGLYLSDWGGYQLLPASPHTNVELILQKLTPYT